MKAILLGSIGTVADTSHMQLAAFNQAFKKHDLSWKWQRRLSNLWNFRSRFGTVQGLRATISDLGSLKRLINDAKATGWNGVMAELRSYTNANVIGFCT